MGRKRRLEPTEAPIMTFSATGSAEVVVRIGGQPVATLAMGPEEKLEVVVRTERKADLIAARASVKVEGNLTGNVTSAHGAITIQGNVQGQVRGPKLVAHGTVVNTF